MQCYFERFPKKAQSELRSLTVLPGSDLPLPPGTYAFLEFYCTDRSCDCCRVIVKVLHDTGGQPAVRRQLSFPLATIRFPVCFSCLLKGKCRVGTNVFPVRLPAVLENFWTERKEAQPTGVPSKNFCVSYEAALAFLASSSR